MSCGGTHLVQWPLAIAHTVIDVAAFLGYAALHGRAIWPPWTSDHLSPNESSCPNG